MAFAFRESSVPAAHVGVTSGSRNAESKRLRSGRTVLCRRDCKATAALSELTHAALMLWLITQLHESGKQFLSLDRISRFSPVVLELEVQSQHCNSRFSDTERDRILLFFSAQKGFSMPDHSM